MLFNLRVCVVWNGRPAVGFVQPCWGWRLSVSLSSRQPVIPASAGPPAVACSPRASGSKSPPILRCSPREPGPGTSKSASKDPVSHTQPRVAAPKSPSPGSQPRVAAPKSLPPRSQPRVTRPTNVHRVSTCKVTHPSPGVTPTKLPLESHP